ncbi:NACHT domain-containing protein [Streptomyces sp. NBC_01296]|uniref:NACHT domain-containing protein n=1 Tax=Streptomyces sp. NBC_01296 TaxID=2903816 RepID=UPI002E13E6C0|nr:NACHT domain-containing protein [Streptomyces sp. NBC_01296]
MAVAAVTRFEATDSVNVVLALVSAVAGLAALVPGLFANADGGALNAATDRLATTVGDGWARRRISLIGDVHPAELPIRRATHLEVGHVRVEAGGDPVGTTSSGIARLFLNTVPRRMLIVGEPGSGKTLIALELALSLLQLRQTRSDTRVAVPFHLAGWDGEGSLGEWLAGRLSSDYRVPAAQARAMVGERRIVPVLDGLDEVDGSHADRMAPGSRTVKIVQQLNGTGLIEWADLPSVVVTCRESDYRRMHEAGLRLRDTLVIRVHPLPESQVENYITQRFESAARPSPLVSSAEFAQSLRNPQSPLAEALRKPWLLGLAIAGLQAGVLDARRLAGSSSYDVLSGELLSAFVEASTLLHPRGLRPSTHVARAAGNSLGGDDEQQRFYDPADVLRWLGTLAAHLESNSTGGSAQRDISPLQLWRLAPVRRVKALHTGVSVVAAAVATAFAAEWADGSLGLALTAGAGAVALGFAAWAGLHPSPRPSRPELRQLARPQVAGPRVSVVLATAGGTAAGALAGGTGPAITSGTGAALAAVILVGLGQGDIRPVWPVDVLRNDLFFGTLLGASLAIAGGLPGGLTGGLAAHLHLTQRLTQAGSIALALAVGLLAGVGLGSRAWSRYAAAVLLAAPGGHVPWRLRHFLEWAYLAGLLRVSGRSYQFRHEELRIQLTPTVAPPSVAP